MSYALLLAPVLLAAAVAAGVALRRDRRAWAAVGLAAAAVLALTVAFDSLMIAADLFRFDEAGLLGVRLGLAPIEDLGYALVAVLVVAALWRLVPARRPAAREAADG
ncbi:lycopene cyclase domain-containing protein [Agrococcus carbonis]|uniref:Lycopene cyclase domain-containing protein n=1 Tax=Agrococcus carbonis TaxID=684552 RepID=A0A1H1P109_9MICO|nr:lycopene cyclase domain-containing protein [Agrococcus carbonis]SDS04873.1 lycopene cyclase domain-containing protein [Agrococcus carbonis]